VHVIHGRGSVPVWRRCDTSCTSGFMDVVTFAHNNWPYGGMLIPLQRVTSLRRRAQANDCDCHHHLFKVEFAFFQAILSFKILQFYAQHCNCKLMSRQAVPTVNNASVIYEYTLFTYLLCH